MGKNNFNYFIMKAKILCIIGCTFCLLFSAFSGFSQSTATVGAIKNGQPVVTSVAEATRALKSGLSDGATISNISIQYSGGDKAYFLVGAVGNDRVSGKAIQLVQDGTILRAVGGPGIEVTCSGIKCSTCIPEIGGKPRIRCVCKDANPPSDMQCNMTSKVAITIW